MTEQQLGTLIIIRHLVDRITTVDLDSKLRKEDAIKLLNRYMKAYYKEEK